MKHVINRLLQAGISLEDAIQLRRIAGTLHRWHEMECGSNYGAIERDEATGIPYQVTFAQNGTRFQTPIFDREASAKKRLALVMARYPSLRAYIQGDPRGAALYILHEDALADGGSIDSHYSNGIAVY
jgi:hypothetical protein